MDYPEELDTPRLTLRRWRPGDAAAHAAMWSDPDVWAALNPGESGDPEAASADSLGRQLRHWEEHGFGMWAVVPRGESEPVGSIGAWYPDFVPDVLGEVEVGWSLRREWWGRGLATEAARQAQLTAFEHLAPDRVISLIAPTNERSAAVAARLGMSQAGSAETNRGQTLRIFELPRPREPTA